jgi:hypothetical protein
MNSDAVCERIVVSNVDAFEDGKSIGLTSTSTLLHLQLSYLPTDPELSTARLWLNNERFSIRLCLDDFNLN